MRPHKVNLLIENQSM